MAQLSPSFEPRAVSARLRRLGAKLSIAFVVMCWLVVTTAQFLESRLTYAAAELPYLVADVERAIGYGGLIHHFKNAVLRPDESSYFDQARRAGGTALDRLDLLERALDRHGIAVDLVKLRSTVTSYLARIDTISAMQRDGATAGEVDRAVRIDDAPALAEVARFRVDVTREVDGHLRRLANLGALMLAMSLFGAACALVMVLNEMRKSEHALISANAALRREQAGNAELREISYAVSHDLKAPMSTLELLLSEMVSGEDGGRLSDDLVQLVEKSRQTVSRAQGQIDDLMRYAGMVATVPTAEDDCNLADVAAAVVRELSDDIAKTRTVVEFGHLPRIPGGRSEMQILLRNLMLNAITYRRPDVPPRVRIDCRKTVGAVEVSVSDNGIGIDPSQHARIFEMFRRLHRHDQIPGTGLGLTICRRVARLSGGDVTVVSVPGEGSTFTLTIPPRREATWTVMSA